VRVITFDPDYSIELCGGTHVDATGEIGYFRLLSESSVAAGVRRVEAATGRAADTLLRKEKGTLSAIEREISSDGDLVSDIRTLLEERKKLQKEKAQLQRQQGSAQLDQLISKAKEIHGDILLIKGEIPHVDMNMLKQLGYEVLEKKQRGVVAILGARNKEKRKAYLMTAISDDLIEEKGLNAGHIVGILEKKLGGGGGGQSGLATAGGNQPERLDVVFEEAEALINAQLEKG
jgi:alanyl-tRNA synthetase